MKKRHTNYLASSLMYIRNSVNLFFFNSFFNSFFFNFLLDLSTIIIIISSALLP